MIRVGAVIVLIYTATVHGLKNEGNGTDDANTFATQNMSRPDSGAELGAEDITPEEEFKWPEIHINEDYLSGFSENVQKGLEKWSITLKNASRKCAKQNLSEVHYPLRIKIDFPAFLSKGQSNLYDAFLRFGDAHPALVRKRGQQSLVNVASLSLMEVSPLLLLCLSCAALSGIIIWALDTRANPSNFPRRFWRGICDGVWWALVTMTTVGYGDKAPKSFLARLFATIWMIAGIILLSMFTAQVSSRLTTEELKNEDHIFGKKIGVPNGLELSDYADNVLSNAIIKEYQSTSDYVEALKSEKWDSALVFHCDDNKETSFEVIQFLELCQVGATLYVDFEDDSDDDWNDDENEEGYIKCMKSHPRLNKKRVEKSNGTRQDKGHSCKKLFNQKNNNAFEFKWIYFKDFSTYLFPLGAVICTILICCILGTIWDFYQRKKGKYDANKSSMKRSRKENDHLMNTEKPKLEMQTV